MGLRGLRYFPWRNTNRGRGIPAQSGELEAKASCQGSPPPPRPGHSQGSPPRVKATSPYSATAWAAQRRESSEASHTNTGSLALLTLLKISPATDARLQPPPAHPEALVIADLFSWLSLPFHPLSTKLLPTGINFYGLIFSSTHNRGLESGKFQTSGCGGGVTLETKVGVGNRQDSLLSHL
ncbi:hypothetical protein LEMLEM_LOCUS16725 [Lemmus lemmus]